jgi:hypothetical protein
VRLSPKLESLKSKDRDSFRSEFFDFLSSQNATSELLEGNPPTPVPIWNSPQGAPVNDFTGYPKLEKYLNEVWIYPRNSLDFCDGIPWVVFEEPGGAYTPDWMVQAAIDRIRNKIGAYDSRGIRKAYSLGEFDLVCHFCDQALLHNTPTHAIGFGFQELSANVRKALEAQPKDFDKVFLFNPHEKEQVIQVM